MSGKPFGQDSPPLYVLIKDILKRYPDGQIFKEMIQNADDAGAKTVQFFIDHRHHGTASLPQPELERFQGPALISANDACFSKEDWEGIQRLQQSIKAEDPFKVGKFGIGFNSVYHITDLPMIISGETVAYLEPHEKIWPMNKGQSYTITWLKTCGSDALVPFHGISGFDPSSSSFPHTLFRLPLRTDPKSKLSGNVYTTEKIGELVDALRDEAKLLLLFLRSVNAIEVYHISIDGEQSLCFRVCISDSFKSAVAVKRDQFKQDLEDAHTHKQSVSVSDVITYTDSFDVEVTNSDSNMSQHTSTHKWLVVNQVGSKSPEVLEAAPQQKAFPWIGVAMELNTDTPRGGRVFCFLPMPIEAASGLPVHVNGTFGLNDDRRSLKWPGPERKNDATADWNKLLVKELLPSCYVGLLLKAVESNLLDPEQFYEMWPSVTSISHTEWDDFLNPFFKQLFSKPVVWCEQTEQWVTVRESVFVPIAKGGVLPSVVQQVLANCSLNIVTVPPPVWDALHRVHVAVTEVSPELTRMQIKRSKPCSYSSISPHEKRDLLGYCLRDEKYSDLEGLELLPLANGSFTSFHSRYQQDATHVYLCSSDYPRDLLPNLEHKLGDLSNESDPLLQSSLYSMANEAATNLYLLTEEKVASLLSDAMPAEWKHENEVALPNGKFPSTWFEQFWQWIQNRKLKCFVGKLVVPISSPSEKRTNHFRVVKLTREQTALYVPSNAECSGVLQQVFAKLQVKYSMQSHFPYLSHKMLLSYFKTFDAKNVLDAISVASQYVKIEFLDDEALELQEHLCSFSLAEISKKQRLVLRNLRIFQTEANSKQKLYSVAQAVSSSVLKTALSMQKKFNLNVTNFPPNLLLFATNSHNQTELLKHLNVPVISDIDLLLKHVFPLIKSGTFPDNLIDPLMKEVLDLFQVFCSRDENFASHIESLPFLNTLPGCTSRVCPSKLFDPSVPILAELYKADHVFPLEPFKEPKYLHILKLCRLRSTVTPQQIVGIISEISSASESSSFPQKVDGLKLSRSKVILRYIGSNDFQQQLRSKSTVSLDAESLTFESAVDSLARKNSWLPVVADPPPNYPQCLKWRGKDYNSHFVPLNRSVVAVSTVDADAVSNLVGSQMFIVVVDEPTVSKLFTHSKNEMTCHVLAHFEEIIKCNEQIPVDVLQHFVITIYSYLESSLKDSDLNMLHSMQNWIYLKKHSKFVCPNVVALNQNCTFRHDLEPYLYVLPESLTPYSTLFTQFGVEAYITQSQILSVLEAIKNKSCPLTESDSSSTWSIIMSILNWITNNGTKAVSPSPGTILYVPISQSDSQWPQLKESSEVVYTDNNFLKEFLLNCGSDETYTFVDSHIPQEMAQCLGLTPLSEYLDISKDTFEDAGQNQDLADRLKEILKEYKDGLTIVKELLQNADDAEASDVNICYDARTHTVAKNSLFFPDMLESHGPALLVHNNKSFSEADFVNITKLRGATKENKQLKIGKFGVGFCSVYHITDVPSFVSNDTLCIFDPKLLHLRKEVQNLSQPGKKVKFTSKVISRSNQLVPYEGLFGFRSGTPFNGTIFRFPFRSSASELSSTCYTEATAKELTSDMQKCGSKLLLFLQHVKRITFQQINEGEQAPKVLLTITKESVHSPLPVKLPPKVKCSIKSANQSRDEHWLVASDSSVIKGKSATASVACQLNHVSSCDEICFTSICELEGELFCYLPLSQKTGLPVHVSSNFAVMKNRRGIWTGDEATSKTYTEVEWNESLMKSVIPNAYLQLLCLLREMCLSNKLQQYVFHSLWPLKNDLLQHNPWQLLVSTLYAMLSTTSEELFYSSCSQRWLKLMESRFLQHGLLSLPASGTETPDCVKRIVSYLKHPIVYLPRKHRYHLRCTENIITDEQFTQLFFENLGEFTDIYKTRNLVIIHMLELYAMEFDDGTSVCYLLDEHFSKHACIPCVPNGVTLRKCKELIDPSSPFAKLFDANDSKFPIKEFNERHLVSSALHYLGMISEKLPWHLLIDRAQTVATLFKQDQNKALQRAKLIIHTLNNRMPKEKPGTSTTIDCVEFLPVLSQPADYHLPWKGQIKQLLSGKELMITGTNGRDDSEYKHASNTIISGSQVAFVCEEPPEKGGCGYIRRETLHLLGIRISPTCDEVIKQLRLCVSEHQYHSRDMTSEVAEWIASLCGRVYSFLDNRIRSSKSKNTKNTVSVLPDLKELYAFPCIWSGEEFLVVEAVAKKWKRNGPYLFPVPSGLSVCENLSALLKIKEEFCLKDTQAALLKMANDFGPNPVNEPSQKLLKELVPLLGDKVEAGPSNDFNIMLPDENFILHWSSELAYNDAPWAPKDTKYTYVNDCIPRALAEKLHVKPVRSKFLEKYTTTADTYFKYSGVEFGQREELTRRISNIIREYPFDITILKELLQNADDAKATKMYVILDKRTHGSQSVLSEEWQNLQGPALLVWNDSTFSEKDLEDIQKLGLGGKRADAETIGQYGIGFNVVYHLTDCPSFITGGETLCIMDPHCRFVPGADPLNPGRRYDNLSDGLWEKFPDIKSTFLQTNVQDCPKELLNGSLFRFPLRHTYDLVRSSRIIQESENECTRGALTANDMHQHLKYWAPQLKDSMLFLNHVSELKFILIKEGSEVMEIEHHFRTAVDSTALAQLYVHTKAFKKSTGSKSYVIMYPLTLTTIERSGTDKQYNVDAKWLIQQGVGDIENEQQEWQFVTKVKPRHGIAAPLETDLSSSQELTLSKIPSVSAATAAFSTSTEVRSFESKTLEGKVFCFLPLPIRTEFPVHINGNFILSSSRRDLWRATNQDQEDDRSKWNTALLTAIASSYAKFLVSCRTFVTVNASLTSVVQMPILNYYQLFPSSTSSATQEPWLQLAKSVYAKLYNSNAQVLASVEQDSHQEASITWCEPRGTSISQQVFFRKAQFFSSDATVVKPILRELKQLHHLCMITMLQLVGVLHMDCLVQLRRLPSELLKSS